MDVDTSGGVLRNVDILLIISRGGVGVEWVVIDGDDQEIISRQLLQFFLSLSIPFPSAVVYSFARLVLKIMVWTI